MAAVQTGPKVPAVPHSPDVIVIGGGVIGLAIARQLARDGMRLLLLERGRCGSESSWAGAGILSPCNPHRNDVLHRFTQRSLALYPAFSAALTEESGIDIEYERCGELRLLFTENALRIARSEERVMAEQGTPGDRPLLEVHTPEQACGMEPTISRDIMGAALCRQTAQVRNPRLIEALAKSCLAAGVEIREGTAVTGIVEDGGRVLGVSTDAGLQAGGAVIVCAGAWSGLLGAHAAALPVHPVKGHIVLLKTPQRPFTPIISHGGTYLVPRRDGHVLLGSTEEPEAGYSKRPTSKAAADLMDAGLSLVPGLAGAAVQAIWTGLRPGTPDNWPYMGAVPGVQGLFAATGHYRAGITLAPATAEVMSAILRGAPYGMELSRFAPGRA